MLTNLKHFFATWNTKSFWRSQAITTTNKTPFSNLVLWQITQIRRQIWYKIKNYFPHINLATIFLPFSFPVQQHEKKIYVYSLFKQCTLITDFCCSSLHLENVDLIQNDNGFFMQCLFQLNSLLFFCADSKTDLWKITMYTFQ